MKMDGGVASSSDVPPDTDTDSFDAFTIVQKNRNSCIHWNHEAVWLVKSERDNIIDWNLKKVQASCAGRIWFHLVDPL